ncbi:MAG: flagellin [Pseudomonadota bacterium]|nr:flagellin [Pseudomonadota bacterium]
MAVVNTNVSASLAQSALMRNERALGSAMEQLSTGSKINSASDDSAGLGMAAKFTAQINGLDMAVKNANDGISMISTAEGALDEVAGMLQRMRELAVQSSNGTMTQEDRDYMDKEYQALDKEIDRIEQNTQWNSTTILAGDAGQGGTSSPQSKVKFQVSSNYASGSPSNDVIEVDFGKLSTATGSLSDVLTQNKAQNAIGTLDTAIKGVNEQRATFGAASNRLTHAVDNMTNIRVNAEASRSRIEDTDYGSTTSELAKAQIIAQAGTAMLAQANQSAQSVLSLLR